jgi:hypothetical protein
MMNEWRNEEKKDALHMLRQCHRPQRSLPLEFCPGCVAYLLRDVGLAALWPSVFIIIYPHTS